MDGVYVVKELNARDTYDFVAGQIEEWFVRGAQKVLLIHSEKARLFLYHSSARFIILDAHDMLEFLETSP